MADKKFSYNKAEKLKSRKQLQQLFIAGNTFTVFPLKIFYEFADAQANSLKGGVGVSKKYFKKAVERNRIKRLLRETYRIEKFVLLPYLEQDKKKIAIFFLYIDKNLPDYFLLKEKMEQAIKTLIKELNEMAS